ncbi:DNA circularization protein [Endozoicomonas acroporae]|uniref:DNA circularization protein n=1 Tax=Endozoicomonas acroporae TaxID=1701104 RepID=UPI0013D11EC5|nr:DNA circularization N-terminal domain-containing protein [Endozoicomonas acroporae]
MSWKEQLRPGSFRGVPFFVRSADDGGGRRRAQHIYAGREEPWSEDMGRKQKEYTLTVFCIGTDYFSQRDALETALNVPGPGLLVHPWRGELYVTVDYRVQHSTEDGGMCTFTLNCTEAGHHDTPTTAVDTAAGLLGAVDNSKAGSIEHFSEQFAINGMPDFVRVDAIRELSDLTETLAGLPGQTSGVTATSMMKDLSPMLGNAGELGSAVYDLVGNVGTLANNFSSGGSSTAAPASSTGIYSGIASLQTLYGYQPTVTTGRYPTVARMQANRNSNAIAALIREASGIESARLLAGTDFTQAFSSRGRAETTVQQVTAQLQELAYDASDRQFHTLNQTRIATLQDYRARAVQLPKVRKVTPKQTEPALVIAYREYGDVNREQEVLKLNNIHHPGFVPGGESLELVNA